MSQIASPSEGPETVVVAGQPSKEVLDRQVLTFFAFCCGLMQHVPIEVVGKLRTTELLIVIAFPFLMSRRAGWLRKGVTQRIVILGVVWLAAQVASDFANGSSPRNYLRGWANIGVILTSFCAYIMVFRDAPRRYVHYLLGASIGGLYVPYDLTSQGQALIYSEIWDLYIASTAFPLTMVVCDHLFRRRPIESIAMICIVGVASVMFGGRSMGLVLFISALLVALGLSKINFSRRYVIAALAVMTIGTSMAFLGYVQLGLSGNLGLKTQFQLKTLKNPYNPAYVIMLSRPHIFTSLKAIRDEPLLGHGSWAVNRGYDHDEELSAITSKQYVRRLGHYEVETIVTHSVLFQAWVFGGVAGGIFWAYVLWLNSRTMLTFLQQKCRELPILMMVVTLNFWNILFSPFGYARIFWPSGMAFCIIALEHAIGSRGWRAAKSPAATVEQ